MVSRGDLEISRGYDSLPKGEGERGERGRGRGRGGRWEREECEKGMNVGKGWGKKGWKKNGGGGSERGQGRRERERCVWVVELQRCSVWLRCLCEAEIPPKAAGVALGTHTS